MALADIDDLAANILGHPAAPGISGLVLKSLLALFALRFRPTVHRVFADVKLLGKQPGFIAVFKIQFGHAQPKLEGKGWDVASLVQDFLFGPFLDTHRVHSLPF